ncbi:hypothetical protein LJR039_001635 [Pseudorhodoferax sp. LjRoot39]|uniref:hypothetical protein n=1 Tax=Pseudorhodoferax sp. LjRoot39 TaxID=3342328 RepID=UPI003ED0248E
MLILAFAAAAALSGGLQHRFLSRLEHQEPTVWSALGKRRVLTDDGDTSYAAAQWYLLNGEFTALNDQSLASLGRHARMSFFGTAAILIAWGVVAIAANASPRLTCFLGIFRLLAPGS